MLEVFEVCDLCVEVDEDRTKKECKFHLPSVYVCESCMEKHYDIIKAYDCYQMALWYKRKLEETT